MWTGASIFREKVNFDELIVTGVQNASDSRVRPSIFMKVAQTGPPYPTLSSAPIRHASGRSELFLQLCALEATHIFQAV